MSFQQDSRLLVRPRVARHILGDCSNERLYKLLNTGEIESFVDGRARWIIAESLGRYVSRRLAEAGGAPKIAPAATPPHGRGKQRETESLAGERRVE